MYLDLLSLPREKKGTINAFGGINRLPNAPENTFYDMSGIAPGDYPIISAGVEKRVIMDWGVNIKGTGFYKKFYYFKDNRLYFDGNATDLYLEGEINSVVGFGNSLVIFPQKVWFNTDNFTSGSLENKTTITSTFKLSSESGSIYSGYTVSATRPETATEGALWLDTSSDKPILKKYVGGAFYELSDVCLYISGKFEGFSEGDSVNVGSSTVSGSFNIRRIGDDFITLGGVAVLSGKNEKIIVSRDIPDITYAIEYGNRIWGCSLSGTEIYASELGKKDCFYTYQGTAGDSYAVSIGENTPFLGAIEFSGRLYFFKSRFVYMIQGTRPQNFQLMRVSDVGISESAPGQVVQHKGYIYYFSNFGLMRFDGSSTEKIDKKLNIAPPKKLICSTGELLYIVYGNDLFCLDHERYEYYKLASDTFEGIYNVGGILFYYNGHDYGAIRILKVNNGEFMLESNPLGKGQEKEGFITRLGLSLYLGQNSELRILVGYDDDDFREVKRISGKAKCFTLPLPIRRCSTLRLKLLGKGDFKLYSLSVYRNEVR